MNNASSSHLDAVSTDFMSLLFKGEPINALLRGEFIPLGHSQDVVAFLNRRTQIQ
jgi:hypothetical protein